MAITWHRTWPESNDDFTAYKGETAIGRVFFGHSHKWHWFLERDPRIMGQAESADAAKVEFERAFRKHASI